MPARRKEIDKAERPPRPRRHSAESRASDRQTGFGQPTILGGGEERVGFRAFSMGCYWGSSAGTAIGSSEL